MNNNTAINPTQHAMAPIQAWLNNETVKRKFVEVLDKGANGFVSSLLSLVNTTPKLKEADPKTVMAAAMTAATLKLPINPNLGLAYIVPYNNCVNGKKVMQAQFQMGWKGFVQLAERSAQYRTINTSAVYEGQIKDIDFITGEIVRGQKISDTVIGYVAYMELTNGFKKTLYMTREEMEHHAREFSKAYAYDLNKGKKSSVWSTNFDAMAQKTVLKLLISKYGIMSIDMQSDHMATAIASDQAIIHKVGEEYEYADNDESQEVIEASQEDGTDKIIDPQEASVPDNIDPETGEILQQKQAQEQELALS